MSARLLLGILGFLAILPSLHADWLWTRQVVTGVGTIRTVTYGNGYFVAATNTGYTLSSRDGTTWTTARPSTIGINDLAYGNGRFVACIAPSNGIKSKVIYSADGIAWTFARRVSNNGVFGSQQGLSVIGTKGGKFISLGSGRNAFAASNTGTRWQNPLDGKAAAKYVGSVTGLATSGAYVLCSSLAGVTIQSSPDGFAWTTKLMTSARGPARGIAAEKPGKRLVCVGENGLCVTSSNGATNWAFHPFGSVDLQGVSFANRLFVSFSDNTVYSTPAGLSWTRQLRLSRSADHLRAIAGGVGLYVAVGNNGKNGLIYVSSGLPGPNTAQ